MKVPEKEEDYETNKKTVLKFFGLGFSKWILESARKAALDATIQNVQPVADAVQPIADAVQSGVHL